MGFFSEKKNIFLILFLFIFLGLLFLTKDKILFTPDFIGDAYHGDISTKFYQAEIYKNNSLPFWTDKINNGYPLLADDLSGSLFLLNIIILRLFPFNIGYNLLFLISLLLISVGFFLILTELGIDDLLSFFLSLNFTFNASITLRFIHLTILQPFSLFPLSFYFLYAYFKKNKKIFFYLSILFFSQIIYAGHPQVAFMSFLSMFIFSLIYLFSSRNLDSKEKISKFFNFILILFLAFCISLPQILPTLRLHQFLKRNPNLDYSNTIYYSFSWNNFVSFLSPFSFGNPKIGTYNFFTPSNDIFWENTPYIGRWLFFLSIFVLLYLIIFVRKNGKEEQRFSLIFLSLFVIFILFSLGKDSPIYLLFALPPFSYFRTQSRYLMFAVLFLFLFIGYLFNKTSKKNFIVKIIIAVILMVNLLELIVFAYNYHLLVDYSKVINTPLIAKRMDQSKYLDIDQGKQWDMTFLTSGWSKKSDVSNYLFFRNYLYPSSGLIFSKSSFNLNSPVTSFNRVNIFKDLIIENIISPESDKDRVPLKTKELLRLLGIKYLITSNKVNDNDFEVIQSVQNNDLKINLYQLRDFSKNFFYIPQNIRKITYLEDFYNLFNKNNNFESLAVYEDSILDSLVKNSQKKFTILRSGFEENKILLSGDFSGKTLVVFKKNFYPEWKAFIDGKETEIYPINLIHMSVVMPPGKHDLLIVYQPSSFTLGMTIALSTLILIFIFD